MRVLVTGATGFVGSHVARALLECGHEVIAGIRAESDRRRIEAFASSLQLIEHDLLRQGPDQLAASEPEVCIHTAWYAEPGSYLSARVNVDLVSASARLAFALADAGCRRFVGVGTCFEYDVDVSPLSESAPVSPRHLYSASKHSLLEILRQVEALTPMQVAWARLFYLYGPHEDPRRLVSSTTKSLVLGKHVELTPGQQVRDFLHVEDVARALLALATSDISQAVNVGSGEPVTVREIVTRLAHIVGRPELLHFGARRYVDGDPMRVLSDPTRLRTETSWRPRYTLDSGLQQTVAWWSERVDIERGSQASA